MDSLSPSLSSDSLSFDAATISLSNPRYQQDALVISATLTSQDDDGEDSVSISFEDLYKSLSVAGRKVIDKLNELLKDQVPDGIQSLEPEDHTPEATADNIVKGVTGYFDLFARQHPELEGEDLITKFLDTIRGGIQQGYDDAVGTLEGIGAFEFDGVKDGVQETKRLIEEKLVAWESQKRKELGLEPNSLDVEKDIVSPVNTTLLAQGGAKLLSVSA